MLHLYDNLGLDFQGINLEKTDGLLRPRPVLFQSITFVSNDGAKVPYPSSITRKAVLALDTLRVIPSSFINMNTVTTHARTLYTPKR